MIQKPETDGKGQRIVSSIADLLVCPHTGGNMTFTQAGYCSASDNNKTIFPVEDGVVRAFMSHDGISNDVTVAMQDFYSAPPFPDYDTGESIGSLIEKSISRGFPEMLNRSIAPNATVLEAGCETGQLGNFLSIVGRRIVSIDMTWNSLLRGQAFKENQRLDTVTFAQMNLFRLPFRPGIFDVVVCSGVLHHTMDPLGGFRALVPLLKPGGHIVIGLYNRFGRTKTIIRQWLYPLIGKRIAGLDPYLQSNDLSEDKKTAWIEDQYRNPKESLHTVDEVIGWFEANDIAFTNSVPPPVFGAKFDQTRSLFEPSAPGTGIDRLAVQLAQMVTDREGGLFIVIGKKR